MSLSEVALLIAIWNGFALIFEIPTGILADRTNRKTLLVVGALLKGSCFIIWYFSHDFWLFALGFVVWALGGAFASGTEESLLFDSLKRDGREEEFTAVYGKVEAFGIVGALIGIVSSGALAMLMSLGTIALLSGVISIVDACLAMNIRGVQTKREMNAEKKESMLDTLRSAIGFIKNSKVALIIVTFVVLVVTIGGYLDEFDALIIADFELDLFWVTIIFTIRFAFMALGDVVAPKLEKRLTSLKSIILLTALGCLLLGVFAILWHPFALAIFGLPFFVLSVVNVLLVSRLNREMTVVARATVLSLLRVGQNFGMIVFALAYGCLSGIVGLQQTYLIVALFGVVTTGVFMVIGRKVAR